MKDIDFSPLVSWFLGLVVFTIGFLNLLLVHAVPGLVFLLLSLLYFPPADKLSTSLFGFPVPFAAKGVLALVIVWFTLGVSDLGDMLDDW